jgi:hypothetical protein
MIVSMGRVDLQNHQIVFILEILKMGNKLERELKEERNK